MQRTSIKETSFIDNKESSATFFQTNSHGLQEQKNLSTVTPPIPKIVITKMMIVKMILQAGGGGD